MWRYSDTEGEFGNQSVKFSSLDFSPFFSSVFFFFFFFYFFFALLLIAVVLVQFCRLHNFMSWLLPKGTADTENVRPLW